MYLVLESSDPLALSLGSGYVVLSKGLILNLDTEGQLFFVIAHEIAHHELGHSKITDETSPKLELQADAFAMKALIRAGYSATEGLSSVMKLSKHPNFRHSDSYPHLETRILELRRTAASNSELPPTRLRSNRQFLSFRRELS